MESDGIVTTRKLQQNKPSLPSPETQSQSGDVHEKEKTFTGVRLKASISQSLESEDLGI